MRSAKFGPDGNITLDMPLDNWLTAPDWFPFKNGTGRRIPVPEVAGSSARVFRGKVQNWSRPIDPAIKLMRPEKPWYGLPLFKREVMALRLLNGTPGVTRLYEFGYLKPDLGVTYPVEDFPKQKADEVKTSGACIKGNAEIFDLEEYEDYLQQMEARTKDGWLPFLVLERRVDICLYLMSDLHYTSGKNFTHFDMEDKLNCALQICAIMQSGHDNQLTYKDHKINHYYYNRYSKTVSVLDWNIGDGPMQALTEDQIAFDILQFSARVLHHLISGRVAPGAIGVAPTRPDEINSAPKTYQPDWNHDDRHYIPKNILDLLEFALSGGYKTCEHLINDLSDHVSQPQN